LIEWKNNPFFHRAQPNLFAIQKAIEQIAGSYTITYYKVIHRDRIKNNHPRFKYLDFCYIFHAQPPADFRLDPLPTDFFNASPNRWRDTGLDVDAELEAFIITGPVLHHTLPVANVFSVIIKGRGQGIAVAGDQVVALVETAR
jgi:hypothetical protein